VTTRFADDRSPRVAVLNSMTSQDAQRGYRHAIHELIDWYGSEPRLAFNLIGLVSARVIFVSVMISRSHIAQNALNLNGSMLAAD
jgi:hypothetical protein